eukprot:g17857.t1
MRPDDPASPVLLTKNGPLRTRSFNPRVQSNERFARQYRYELPPEFPLASPCSGIDHHLSGPNRYALTQIYRKRRSVDSAPPR